MAVTTAETTVIIAALPLLGALGGAVYTRRWEKERRTEDWEREGKRADREDKRAFAQRMSTELLAAHTDLLSELNRTVRALRDLESAWDGENAFGDPHSRDGLLDIDMLMSLDGPIARVDLVASEAARLVAGTAVNSIKVAVLRTGLLRHQSGPFGAAEEIDASRAELRRVLDLAEGAIKRYLLHARADLGRSDLLLEWPPAES
jgi:hypothetical protein